MKTRMTDEEIKKEFLRWVDAGRPSVSVSSISDDTLEWDTIRKPLWLPGSIYIVNDRQVELRKLQYDKPDTKFLFRSIGGSEDDWDDISSPAWVTDHEYKVKPREWWGYASVENKILCWVWNDSSKIKVARQIIRRRLSGVYVSYGAQEWEYAEPIKPEDCWTAPITYASTS